MDIIHLEPNSDGVVEWPTLSDEKRAVVTIGNFDGVHKGHQAVLNRARALAEQYDVPSVAITFDPRPSVVHSYAASHDGEQLAEYADEFAVMSLNHRLKLIEQAGFDYALVVRYTLEFAARTYIFFLGQLVGKLGMRTLVLGMDATMGKGREGNIGAIAKLSAATGVFELDVVDDCGPSGVFVPRTLEYAVPQNDGEPHNPMTGMTKAELRAWTKKHNSVATRAYSSSMIRFLLARGCMHDAAEILGRPHSIDAVVEHGAARGRELGFPTANCGQIDGFVPVDGVYAGYVTVLGEDGASREHYAAAISVGTNSTFSETSRSVEAYCVDVPDSEFNLYDARLRVEFTDYLRPMRTFESADALVEQMARDVERVRELNV